jgi:hypothetical protein
MQIVRWASQGLIPSCEKLATNRYEFKNTPELQQWIRENQKYSSIEEALRDLSGERLSPGRKKLLQIVKLAKMATRNFTLKPTGEQKEQMKKDLLPMYLELKKIYGD